MPTKLKEKTAAETRHHEAMELMDAARKAQQKRHHKKAKELFLLAAKSERWRC